MPNSHTGRVESPLWLLREAMALPYGECQKRLLAMVASGELELVLEEAAAVQERNRWLQEELAEIRRKVENLHGDAKRLKLKALL